MLSSARETRWALDQKLRQGLFSVIDNISLKAASHSQKNETHIACQIFFIQSCKNRNSKNFVMFKGLYIISKDLKDSKNSKNFKRFTKIWKNLRFLRRFHEIFTRVEKLHGADQTQTRPSRFQSWR